MMTRYCSLGNQPESPKPFDNVQSPPAAMNLVAKVCRKSWNRQSFTKARRHAILKASSMSS